MKNGKQGKYIKLLTMAILVTLTENTVLAADTSEIIIDKSNGKAPMVTTAGNGVPVINIQKPNSKGLSHNQYKSFNVGQKGIIFNNARNGTNVKTQLGGYIMGNANITTQTAKTILNEVTSNTASKINGFMEIAGQKANLIISNPNGIQIGNSGYINVNRGILTTGKPQIGADGNLNGFKVDRGEVIIDNFGFDATAASSAEIYAQAVQINAKLCAENLNVITGKNTIDSNGNIAEVTDDTEYVGVSLDVGRLGGMYAGAIKLIGTAKGVGVNTDGEIYAQRQLAIDERGKIVITENGKAVSDIDSKIASKNAVNNVGIINAGKKLSIKVKDLNNTDTGKIYGTDINIETENLNNKAYNANTPVIAARNNMGIVAGSITNSTEQHLENDAHAVLMAGNDMSITADILNNKSATIESGNNMVLNVLTLNNTNEHYRFEREVVDEQDRYEVQNYGKSVRYNKTDAGVRYEDDDDEAYALRTPAARTCEWYEYKYHRVIEEDVLKEADPSFITAGGNIFFTGTTFTNDKSKFIAGKDNVIQADTINNIDGKGYQYITDRGTGYYYYKDDSGHGHNHKMVTRTDTFAYNNYIQPEITVYANENKKGVTDLTGYKNEDTAAGIPANGILTLAPPDAEYYVEADPQFADEGIWLSSDYFFETMKYDPDKIAKRLGDGYYEQTEIRRQLMQAEGIRILPEYSSDEEQYQTMMDNAAEFARTTDIKIGEPLTEEQQKQLTEPVVWYEYRNVKLSDGTETVALTPKVYLPENMETPVMNATIGGQNISILTKDDIVNTGNITAIENLQLEGDSISNLYGLITGKGIKIKSEENITNTGGNIIGKDNVTLDAKKDINIQTTTTTNRTQNMSGTVLNQTAGVYVTGDNGTTDIKAGNNVNIQAAQVAATGKNGKINIEAGKDVNLTTQQIATAQNFRFSTGYNKESRTQDVGSDITAQGDINIKAGQNLNAKAANVTAENITATAGENINIEAGQTTSDIEHYKKVTRKGTFSTRTSEKLDKVKEEGSIAATFNGGTVTMASGRDTKVTGSNIIATKDVDLQAEGNIDIEAAEGKIGETHYSKTTKSGFLSGKGFGFTIGKQKTTDELDSVTKYLSGSTIGSIEGNVSITAQENVKVNAGDIIAGNNINITGKDVKITAGQENYAYDYKHEESMKGLHISLGGGVVGTVQENIVQPLERSRQVSNDKLSALYDIKAASKIKETGNEIKKEAAKGKKGDWAHLNVGFGSSKSEYTENGENTTAHSSNITAGENVSITATGKNIDIKGSNVTGENVTLTAKENVNIEATENSSTFDSKDKHSGSEIGVSFSVNGTSVYANAYDMKEKGEGTTTTHAQSNVTANNELNITSGADTNIIGSKVTGEKVNADIGGNLNIESLQDSEKQDYETSGRSVSGSFGVSDGLNVQANKSEMDSEYNSVSEQAGIYAGNRGFDITVAGNTDLKGAVIDSTADKENNNLNTGTISFSDIDNKAEYSTSGRGVNIQKTFGKGGMTDEQKAWEGVTPATGIGTKDDDESTTKSAIAEARINIMKPDRQKQDITKLDRNTTKTLNKLGKIFDKEKVEEKQELAGVFQEMWHTTVGDLMQDKTITDDQRKALNILGGAIAAELGGADIKAGLTGGATTELLQSAFSKIKSQSLRNVAVALVAASVAKGTGQEAATAANVAVAIQKFNEDSHDIAEILNENKEYASEEEKQKDLEQTAKVIEKMRQDGWNSAGTEVLNGAVYAKEFVTDAVVDTTMASVEQAIKTGVFSEPGTMDSDYEYRGGFGKVGIGLGGDVILDNYGKVYLRISTSAGPSLGKGVNFGDGFIENKKDKGDFEKDIAGISAGYEHGFGFTGSVNGSLFSDNVSVTTEAGFKTGAGIGLNGSFTVYIGDIKEFRRKVMKGKI